MDSILMGLKEQMSRCNVKDDKSLLSLLKEIKKLQRANNILDKGEEFLLKFKSLSVPRCPFASKLFVRQVCQVTGLGLFTSVNIPKGAWITNYGCDSVLLNGCDDYAAFDGDKANLSVIVKTHALDVEHDCVQRIASNSINDPAYLAHMANDGPGPTFLKDVKLDSTMFNASLKYLQQVTTTCNSKMVRHRNGTATLQAVVDIPANSEIRWAYGFDYWASEKWSEKMSQVELQKKMWPSPGTPSYTVFTKCTSAFQVNDFFQSPSPCQCSTCKDNE